MTEIEEKQRNIRQGIDEIRGLAKKPMTWQAAWNRLRQLKPELFTALDSPSGGLQHPYPQPTVGTQASGDNGEQDRSRLMDNHRLSLVVPAFNEERTIHTVLGRIFEFLPDVHEVIVVDDASVDRTPELSHEYGDRDKRVKLFRHKTNLGKTAALQTGFAACTGSIVVVQDSDLEYDPREISDLIAPIKEGVADVCLGSRFLVHRAGRVLYFRHFLANKFLTFINNVLTDLNLTDVETGYKAARAEIAKNMIIQSSGFGFEIEFVAKCKKIGARMYEVPISYYGRTYEEGKKVGLKDGLHALWYLIKFNLLTGLKQSFRRPFLEAKAYPKKGTETVG